MKYRLNVTFVPDRMSDRSFLITEDQFEALAKMPAQDDWIVLPDGRGAVVLRVDQIALMTMTEYVEPSGDR